MYYALAIQPSPLSIQSTKLGWFSVDCVIGSGLPAVAAKFGFKGCRPWKTHQFNPFVYCLWAMLLFFFPFLYFFFCFLLPRNFCGNVTTENCMKGSVPVPSFPLPMYYSSVQSAELERIPIYQY